MSRRWLLFFLIFHLVMLEIHAEILRPLHTRSGLDRPIEEDAVHVKTAQIVIFDRRLLIHDFPILENYSDDELKKFLLKHFAYMSLPQAGQSIVNSPVEIDREDKRPALRPDYYRRSLVFEELGGLFDLKGAGSLRPKLHDHFYTHRNGLFSLAHALREYMDDHGYYYENSESRTHAVAEKNPNAFGLFDMCGNVSEWTADEYMFPLPGGIDPSVKPSPGSYRMLFLGGSWYDDARNARSAYRDYDKSWRSHSYLGFRPVRTE